MKHLRFLLFALACFIPVSSVRAQVTDTVFVEITFPDPELESVRITEFISNLEVGATFQFVAETYDQNGELIEAIVRWRSTNTTKLRIDSISGLATAVDTGRAAVIASATLDPTPPPPNGLLFSDGFESGDLANAVGGTWSRANVDVTDLVAHTGTYSARHTWYTANPDTIGDAGGNAGAHLTAHLNERIQGVDTVWVEGWVFYPDGTEGLGPRVIHRRVRDSSHYWTWKLFRIYAAPYLTGPSIGIDYTQPDTISESNRMGISFRGDAGPQWGWWKIAGTHPMPTGFGDVIPLGRWHQQRFMAVEASCLGCFDGVFYMWVDGVEVYGLEDILAEVASGDPISFWGGPRDDGTPVHYWDTFYFGGQASNAGFDEHYVFTYVDDIRAGRGTPSWFD